jgi:hypothetical protein
MAYSIASGLLKCSGYTARAIKRARTLGLYDEVLHPEPSQQEIDPVLLPSHLIRCPIQYLSKKFEEDILCNPLTRQAVYRMCFKVNPTALDESGPLFPNPIDAPALHR